MNNIWYDHEIWCPWNFQQVLTSLFTLYKNALNICEKRNDQCKRGGCHAVCVCVCVVCQCIIKIYYIETAHYHVDWTYSVKQRIKIPNCAVILSFSSLSLLVSDPLQLSFSPSLLFRFSSFLCLITSFGLSIFNFTFHIHLLHLFLVCFPFLSSFSLCSPPLYIYIFLSIH